MSGIQSKPSERVSIMSVFYIASANLSRREPAHRPRHPARRHRDRPLPAQARDCAPGYPTRTPSRIALAASGGGLCRCGAPRCDHDRIFRLQLAPSAHQSAQDMGPVARYRRYISAMSSSTMAIPSASPRWKRRGCALAFPRASTATIITRDFHLGLHGRRGVKKRPARARCRHGSWVPTA